MMKPETPYCRSSRSYLFLAISALTLVLCIGAANSAAAEHIESTPQEVFDAMRGSFQPAKAREFTLVINGT